MAEPTPRERVVHALRGEPTGAVARGEFFISDEFSAAFVGPGGPAVDHWAQQRRVVEELGLDIASVTFSAGWGAPQQPDEDRALAEVVQWHSVGDRFLFALIDGPFSRAVKARGFDMLLHYARGAPHLARELFQEGAEESGSLARALRDAGVDGVILGEDIAYGRSTYLSPRDLKEQYIPELRAAARRIHELGLAVFFHSDGNLDAVLADLAASGLDGLQGLEPESGMEIGPVRERVAPALTLWGNLGFEFLSAPRTDAEIAAAVRALVEPNASAGRFILGSSGGLVQGMNPDTVRRVYRAVAAL